MTSRTEIGSVLAGRFRLVEKLGEGSVGEVFLAEHNVLGRRYAIKVLKDQFQADIQLLERFRREALVASRLEHPNIVFISDFGQAEDGRFYLAMEHIQGESLADVIEDAEPGVIALNRALAILRQMADALGAAHDAGVIHRDLKPENVMLTRDNLGEERVKILDFGLAKIMVDTQMFKLTRRGEIFGTPMFMSPEQARGEPVDARTDIYSFGVMAFELLTGRPPFMADTLEELIIANQKEVPPPPSQVRPYEAVPLPPELDRCVANCLAKSADERPSAMRGVLAALEVGTKRARKPTRPYTAATPATESSVRTPPVAHPPPTARESAPTIPATAPLDVASLGRTLQSPVTTEDAARLAEEDPWQWRRVSKRLRHLASQLLESGLGSSQIGDLRHQLDEQEARLLTLQRELAFPTARLEDLEQAHRERTAQLRHAVIDLGLERSRVAEQPDHDPGPLADLDFQIQSLEERLAQEYRTGKDQAAGVEQEVAALEAQRTGLVDAQTQIELALLTTIRQTRPTDLPSELGAAYVELEQLLRGDR